VSIQVCCKTSHAGSHADFCVHRRAQRRAWYKKNKHRQHAKRKEYRSANRAKLNARDKQYRDNHKDLVRAYRQKYRAHNKDRVNAYYREYYQNNRDSILMRNAAYRASHRELVRQQARESYRRCDKAKRRVVTNRWARENPERVRGYKRSKERRSRESMGDRYMRALLVDAFIGLKGHPIPRALIEAKRAQLMIQRLTRSNT
jgi:hypothetical protein